ncbi:MAG: Uma2 family endonuclease [Cyanobacteria bacterium P01_A01_bin.3]
MKGQADGYSSSHPKPEDIFLLVEISNSTVEYDLGTKVGLYASSGIKEYWVVGLPNKQVWLHRKPAGNRYLDVRAVNSGEIAPLEFLNVEINVGNLFKHS